jgi:transcriptional regulator GlxA family with amidase domain
MSRRGLHKAFVKHTGKGPGCVLREFRMKLAQQLLRDSRIPIEEGAFRSGYQLLNSLYVAFRRHAGVSPAAFRGTAFCMGGLRRKKPRVLLL